MSRNKNNSSEVVVSSETGGYFITADEMAEWNALEGENAKRALTYRKKCKKNDVHPVPPSQWLKCSLCDYMAPESLVNHINSVHGGTIEYAKAAGLMPEMVQLTATAVIDRLRDAGRRGAAMTNAARKAVQEVPVEENELEEAVA